MSKAAQENERVRLALTEALFSWMKRKPFSEITVTDLVTEAHVARASYYRNFSSKESIIEEYIESIYQALSADDTIPDFSFQKPCDALTNRFEHSFTCLLTRKSYILALYHNGFGSLVLETMNRVMEDTAGDMLHNSVERYHLYFLTGAAFNVLLQWLESGAIESPHEMATACAGFYAMG